MQHHIKANKRNKVTFQADVRQWRTIFIICCNPSCWVLGGFGDKTTRQKAELVMLRFAWGMTKIDRIRNWFIRQTTQAEPFEGKARDMRLLWFGLVLMRDSEYLGRRMLKIKLPGKRREGSPRWWGRMQRIERDGDGWSSVENPNQEQPEAEEEEAAVLLIVYFNNFSA